MNRFSFPPFPFLTALSLFRASRRGLVAAGLAACALPFGPTGCSREAGRGATDAVLPPGTPVVVLGDSIAAGYGASRDAAFPARLQAATGWEVVNAGVSGDTSSGALLRLAPLLETHRPALVVVEIGGNDLLRGVPPERTRANIDQMLSRVAAAGARAVLVAVPEPNLFAYQLGRLSDHPMYRELATAHGALLVEGAVSRALARASTRVDPIHPNADGQRLIGESLVAALKAAGLAR